MGLKFRIIVVTFISNILLPALTLKGREDQLFEGLQRFGLNFFQKLTVSFGWTALRY